MDDKDFRKHLQDLAHGHHHPEEHDWGSDAPARKSIKAPARKAASRKKKKSR
jgi:hypothetical protein